MIEAVYHKKYNMLTVTGHANSGEPGHDLVCASASILAYTLAANVETLVEAGQARYPSIKLEAGDAKVRCEVVRRYSSVVQLIFSSVCAGFALLASNYPDYITYKVMG